MLYALNAYSDVYQLIFKTGVGRGEARTEVTAAGRRDALPGLDVEKSR